MTRVLEAATVEGRLADLIESGEVAIDDYLVSSSDKRVIVKALRAVSERHLDNPPTT